MKLTILLLLSIFLLTSFSQQIEERSNLPYRVRDNKHYGLEEYEKINYDLTKKISSDMIFIEDDLFKETQQYPSEMRRRHNLMSERKKIEDWYNAKSKYLGEKNRKKPSRGINLLKDLNDRSMSTAVSESIYVAWVKHSGSGLAPGYDRATDIAIDNKGNVYVTGYSTKLPYGTDYYTAKYSSGGSLIWHARYSGKGYIDNQAIGLAVDGSGNVYVTGYSYALGTGNDYATIKYNKDGIEQWVKIYNGPGNSDDEAIGLSLDGSGNVYVTGYSYGSGTGNDYVTIKYNKDGIEQWVKKYNGSDNNDDEPTAIAVDGSGNVYVTGKSRTSKNLYVFDYATIKYNSNGIEQWVKRYNGPGNDNDEPTAIAVDGYGNVYVTGDSFTSETYDDYATIKYNANGVEQWVKRYNGTRNRYDLATAIAVDGSGNVYVTGTSDGSDTGDDFATIKYNKDGVEQWVKRYNGFVEFWEVAKAITVDGSGNVYVIGCSYDLDLFYDYITIKYNTNGVEQWVKRYNGPAKNWDVVTAIAVDGSGNVYVTGSSWGSKANPDYLTIKYNTNGEEQWIRRYNGPGNSDCYVTAITVDVLGNFYITGKSSGDYVTIKYNTNGVQQWVKKYDGPWNYLDESKAIAVDGSGNVYVTGYSYGLNSKNLINTDYITIKYNKDGVEQWVKSYYGPSDRDDEPIAIAVDVSGNVYVTGLSFSSSTSYDYATIKYNTNGVEQWVKRYDGPVSRADEPIDIAVDGSGNVYVTGRSSGFERTYDYATIKYNKDGVEQWVKRYNGPINYFDEPTAIAVDGSGNVYVTGSSWGPAKNEIYKDADYATIKYNKDGVEQWIKRYDGPANLGDAASAIAVDGSGNVYVTGTSYGSDTDFDYVTIKYNKDGVEQWIKRYNGTGNGWDEATALAIDGLGNVYVTGDSKGLGTGKDYATIKYNKDGVEQWIERYDGIGNYDNFTRGIKLDGSGNVYVTGYSKGSFWSITTTIKYTALPGSVKEENSDLPLTFELFQNYPNPLNPSTTIKFALPERTTVNLSIYNILGVKEDELINGEMDAGYHEVQWDASKFTSGIYLYTLQAGKFSKTKKLIFMK